MDLRDDSFLVLAGADTVVSSAAGAASALSASMSGFDCSAAVVGASLGLSSEVPFDDVFAGYDA